MMKSMEIELKKAELLGLIDAELAHRGMCIKGTKHFQKALNVTRQDYFFLLDELEKEGKITIGTYWDDGIRRRKIDIR